MKKNGLYIILIFLSLKALSQPAKFIVYSVKGNPTSVNSKKILKTGSRINNNDFVKVSKNEALVL